MIVWAEHHRATILEQKACRGRARGHVHVDMRRLRGKAVRRADIGVQAVYDPRGSRRGGCDCLLSMPEHLRAKAFRDRGEERVLGIDVKIEHSFGNSYTVQVRAGRLFSFSFKPTRATLQA